MERLLRYLGQAPCSYAVIPISRYLCYAAAADGTGVTVEHLKDSGGAPTVHHSDLPWLVWYGTEPRHVASLLVTLGKLVTVADSKAAKAPASCDVKLSRPGGAMVVVPMGRVLCGVKNCAVVACREVLRVCSSGSMLDRDRVVAGTGGGAEVGIGGGCSGSRPAWVIGGCDGGGSSSSGGGGGSGSGPQRMHTTVFAMTELLPRLADGPNKALLWIASDACMREVMRPTTGSTNDRELLVLLSACLVPFLRAASVAVYGWLCSCKAVCDAAGGEGTATAAAAAEGSWRQLLLRDVGLLRVLGHVLQALPHSRTCGLRRPFWRWSCAAWWPRPSRKRCVAASSHRHAEPWARRRGVVRCLPCGARQSCCQLRVRARWWAIAAVHGGAGWRQPCGSARGAVGWTSGGSRQRGPGRATGGARTWRGPERR